MHACMEWFLKTTDACVPSAPRIRHFRCDCAILPTPIGRKALFASALLFACSCHVGDVASRHLDQSMHELCVCAAGMEWYMSLIPPRKFNNSCMLFWTVGYKPSTSPCQYYEGQPAALYHGAGTCDTKVTYLTMHWFQLKLTVLLVSEAVRESPDWTLGPDAGCVRMQKFCESRCLSYAGQC